jgi:hypothetical protein
MTICTYEPEGSHIKEGDILIDGYMWTDIDLNTCLAFLQEDGITIYVSKDVILNSKESQMWHMPGHVWLPKSALPKVKDIFAFSTIFKNNRYNLKDKRYDRQAFEDSCILKNTIS